MLLTLPGEFLFIPFCYVFFRSLNWRRSCRLWKIPTRLKKRERERAEKHISQPEKLIHLIINYYYYYSQGTSLEFSSTHAQSLFFLILCLVPFILLQGKYCKAQHCQKNYCSKSSKWPCHLLSMRLWKTRWGGEILDGLQRHNPPLDGDESLSVSVSGVCLVSTGETDHGGRGGGHLCPVIYVFCPICLMRIFMDWDWCPMSIHWLVGSSVVQATRT